MRMITYSIDLDVMIEEDEKLDALRDQGTFQWRTSVGPVRVDVIQLAGPGGGFPFVTITGTAPQLLSWLLEHYQQDDLSEALDVLGSRGNVNIRVVK